MSQEEFLMTPGPTHIPLRVIQAMVRPAISPGDSEFVKIHDETEEMLREIFKTKNEVIIFPGSGRISIESSVLSIIQPKDKILIAVNGVFGKWFKETIQRHGGIPIIVEPDWRKAIEPSDVEKS